MEKIATTKGLALAAIRIRRAIDDWDIEQGEFDIYDVGDGSFVIKPHKISFDEAENYARSFIRNRNGRARNVNYFWPYRDYIVICVIHHGTSVKVGCAKFNTADKVFSPIVGQALAYSRASEIPLPAPLAIYLGVKQ